MSGSFHRSCDFFVIPWGMRWEINKYNMWRTGKWKITEREEQHGREHPTFCAGFGLWPFQRLSGKFRKRFWVVGFFLLERIMLFPWHYLFFFCLMGDFVVLGVFHLRAQKANWNKEKPSHFPPTLYTKLNLFYINGVLPPKLWRMLQGLT